MTHRIQTARSKLQAIQERISVIDAEIDAAGEATMAATMSRDSLQSVASDLNREIRSLITARGFEAIDWRLVGREVRDGSIPVALLTSLSTPLNQAFYATAEHLRSGREMSRVKVPEDSPLHLRLQAVTHGSTRLLFTARAEPDIFGTSLADRTFSTVLDLLNSVDEDDDAESLLIAGATAARKFREVLEVLHKHSVEVEVSWRNDALKRRTWKGTREKVLHLRDSLQLTEQVSTEIQTRALVDTISLRGRVDLRQVGDDDVPFGNLMKATYTYATADQVWPRRVGEIVNVRLRRLTARNAVTRRERRGYLVLAMEADAASGARG